MNHRSPAWQALLILCVTLSCGKSPDPALPPSVSPPIDGGVFAFPSGSTGQNEFLLSKYQIQFDPETLALVVEPLKEARFSQGPQGDIYDFDLGTVGLQAGFNPLLMWMPGGVTVTEQGDVELHFIHRHPVAAPEFTTPSASNRADLSYTGRAVLLLGNSPGQVHTFASMVGANPAVANTEVVLEPDGYVHLNFASSEEIVPQSGPLGQVPVPTPNVFPYVLLVDEKRDNRIGVENGGGGNWGNYEVASGGWQRSNASSLSGLNDGWTGFDVLHAGQASEVTLTLSGQALLQGPVSLGVALLAKYAIPQHSIGESQAYLYRLPAAPWPGNPIFGADPANPLTNFGPYDHWFAYRMPHGALDVSQLDVENEPYIVRFGDPEFNVSLKVRDWDAVAPEAPANTPLYDPEAENGVQPVPIDRVAPGTSWPTAQSANNFPTLGWRLDEGTGSPAEEPAISEWQMYAGRPDTDLNETELRFAFQIEPGALNLINGGYFYGLARITDPENGLMNLSASYGHQGIIPGSNPLATDNRKQEVINYQAVRFYACPQITSVQPTSVSCGQMTTFTATTDLTLPPDATLSWNFGDGAQPQIANGPEPQVLITGEGGIEYFGVLTLQINSAPPGCRTMTFPFSYTPSQCAGPTMPPAAAVQPDQMSNTRGRYDVAIANIGGTESLTIAYFDDINATSGDPDFWPHLVQLNPANNAVLSGPVQLPDFGNGPFAMTVSDIELAQIGQAWMVVVADGTDGESREGATSVWSTAGLVVGAGINPQPYPLVDGFAVNAPSGDLELINQNGTVVLLVGTSYGVNCSQAVPPCAAGLTAIQAVAPGIPGNVQGWNVPIILDNYQDPANPSAARPYSVSADWDPATQRLVAAVGLSNAVTGANTILIYDNLNPAVPDPTPGPLDFNAVHQLTTNFPGGAEIRLTGGQVYLAYASPYSICQIEGSPASALNSGYLDIHHSAANPALVGTWADYRLEQPGLVNCGQCGYWELDQQVAFEVLGGRPTVAFIRQVRSTVAGCPGEGPTARIFRACSAAPLSACDWGSETLLQNVFLPDDTMSTEIALGFSPQLGFVSGTLGSGTVPLSDAALNWIQVPAAW